MRKRAHHRELQLSNYHVCNFMFKTYFGSWDFFGFRLSARLQGFCRGFFFSFLCVLTSGVFQTLLYLGTNVWQQSNWLKVINVSNRSVSCRKITEKVDKSFCRRNFLSVLWGILVWPGQRRNVQRICLQKSFKAMPRSYLEFFPKECHSTMMDGHSSSPKSFLSRPP